MTIDNFASRIEFAAMMHFVRDLEETGQAPVFRVMESATTGNVRVADADRIMLGSNNYLGLATHPKVLEAARDAIDRYGAASTGSRVANGSSALHTELEAELADWHGCQSALLFPTGYQTNVGTISALIRETDTVILDWAAHASLNDGVRLAGADTARIQHNDVDELHELLYRTAQSGTPTMVVVDGLYSMEGDVAPLDRIAALCDRFDAMLMVDEAHSAGILGPNRTGAVEQYGVAESVDIRMGTLSKAIGSIGGYVVGPSDLIDYLRTHARAFQFTTAATPASVAAALAAVRVIRSAEGAERAERLLANVRRLRDGLAAHDVPTLAPSLDPRGEQLLGPIVPVPIDGEPMLVEVWNELFRRGIFSGISVFPGVRMGKPLLRLCVTAEHSAADIDLVADTIADVVPVSHQPVPAL